MTILFLDFDGVLHPKNTDRETVFCRVELLWKILRACPNLEVVFSTSWRELHKFDELLDFVTCGGGEDLAQRFIGVNPSIVLESGANLAGQIYQREDECISWLVTNNQSQRPWLALDDTDCWFVGSNLYLVNSETGLTDADVLAIVGRINAGIS